MDRFSSETINWANMPTRAPKGRFATRYMKEWPSETKTRHLKKKIVDLELPTPQRVLEAKARYEERAKVVVDKTRVLMEMRKKYMDEFNEMSAEEKTKGWYECQDQMADVSNAAMWRELHFRHIEYTYNDCEQEIFASSKIELTRAFLNFFGHGLFLRPPPIIPRDEEPPTEIVIKEEPIWEQQEPGTPRPMTPVVEWAEPEPVHGPVMEPQLSPVRPVVQVVEEAEPGPVKAPRTSKASEPISKPEPSAEQASSTSKPITPVDKEAKPEPAIPQPVVPAVVKHPEPATRPIKKPRPTIGQISTMLLNKVQTEQSVEEAGPTREQQSISPKASEQPPTILKPSEPVQKHQPGTSKSVAKEAEPVRQEQNSKTSEAPEPPEKLQLIIPRHLVPVVPLAEPVRKPLKIKTQQPRTPMVPVKAQLKLKAQLEIKAHLEKPADTVDKGAEPVIKQQQPKTPKASEPAKKQQPRTPTVPVKAQKEAKSQLELKAQLEVKAQLEKPAVPVAKKAEPVKIQQSRKSTALASSSVNKKMKTTPPVGPVAKEAEPEPTIEQENNPPVAQEARPFKKAVRRHKRQKQEDREPEDPVAEEAEPVRPPRPRRASTRVVPAAEPEPETEPRPRRASTRVVPAPKPDGEQEQQKRGKKRKAVDVWCSCQEDIDDHFIGCDNPACPIQWFHFTCVGVISVPKGDWFCDECRPEMQKKMKQKKKKDKKK